MNTNRNQQANQASTTNKSSQAGQASQASQASSAGKSAGGAATNSMKYEIANEFGVELGPDASARSNGSVGGEITKRLVSSGKAAAQQQSAKSTNTNTTAE